MSIITIYTPTYNRAGLLERAYKSLTRQTNKNFIWQIIDDGSTDFTKELVENWKKVNNGFDLRYVYKENGGVHTARDLAYQICETELICTLDSDDWMVDTAVETMLDFWLTYGSKEYAGMFVPNMYANGKIVGSQFPNIKSVSYQDYTYKYKCKGDKHSILRTAVIQMIPQSPVFPDENLVAEGFKWIQIPEDRPFLLLNQPLFVVEYQSDGYSKNDRKNMFRNLNGFRANAKQHIISAKYFRVRLRNQIKYIMYSLWLKDKNFIKNSPKPVQTMLLAPIGFVIFLIMDKKWGKYKG